ncbi:CoA-binding protein [Salinisphaera orenii MK-B5]|uniref:CoA-binding protein n=1 Tax=Salinisphaera orenii MK-B5 TaxID=856730 RepID=A0A423PHH3_9GAMM|nr:acetate--CoA ligase family protein [Salinisphaera orenii]ROO24993.1 CoA-binding protein [Salinisphaera orenii MK-B5]
MTSRAPDPQAVQNLLEPNAVAIIGASAEPTRIGGRPVDYLKQAGFAGPIYPINPNRDVVQGLTAYASVLDTPERPDLAILAIPAAAVVDAVAECGRRGVRAAIIFSAGFAEVGAAGVEAQQQLLATAREYGVRLLGPNCLGGMNISRGLIATFSSSVQSGLPQAGRIGFVTQSGAFGSHCFALARARGLGLSRLVTTGNECDLDAADCLAYLAADADTDVIALHLEGCRDGERMKAALDAVQASGKPVIALKGGESDIGAAAAMSHTANLAGADAAYDALFRRYPVYRAHSIREFIDVAHAAARSALPRGNRLGLITVSGGVGIMMADAASHHDLDVAPMPEAAQRELHDMWPNATTRNPVDTTAQPVSDPEMNANFQRVMLREGNYDVIVNFLSMLPLAPALAAKLRPPLQALRREYPDNVLMIAAMCTPEAQADFEADGYLVFEDPTAAVDTAAALTDLGRRLAHSTPWQRTAVDCPARVAAGQRYAEFDALALLADAGVPVVPARRAASADDAAAAAAEIGFPVVLKIASPDILHKSDAGGVALSLQDEAAVRAAYDRVMANARGYDAQARLDGVLVAAMLSGGVEMAVGVQNDPTFGPMVMAGLGGVFIEILEDVTFELAPFGPAEARAMLQRLRGYPLLTGARGAAPADVDALADALVRLSEFAAANAATLASVDINPLLVMPAGQGLAAVDAVVLSKDDANA